jgi:predicted nucleic acid-binding protein
MNNIRVVIDTNVLISALRSQRGASAALMSQLGTNPGWQMNLSVALLEEYAEVDHRQGRLIGMAWQDCEDFLDYICAARVERVI